MTANWLIIALIFVASLADVICSNSSWAHDFSNLRDVVEESLTADRAALTKSLCDPFNISMPKSSIMMTYANLPSFQFVELQFKAMDTWTPGLQKCLESKYIIVNTDKQGFDRCKLMGFINCALVEVNSLNDYSRQFSAGFFAFSFFKYELIIEALKQVNEMFFFDADILMFKSPWIDDNALYKIDETTGQRVEPMYEYMFQREHGYDFQCNSGDVNGGQYYLRNTTNVHKFLSAMLGFKEKILSYSEGKFDQEYVSAAIESSGVKVCGLNPYRFTSGWHAFVFKTNDHLPVGVLITLHFDGLNGDKGSARLNKMKHFLEVVKDKPDTVIGTIYDKRSYKEGTSRLRG